MHKTRFSYESDAAVDWLTVTTTRRNDGNRLLDIYSRYKSGDDRPATFFGFDCRRDRAGLTWGRRPKDGRYILIAPGATAQMIFLKLAPLPVKVTRIDLACDVWLDTPRNQVEHSARVPMSPSHESKIKSVYTTGRGGTDRKRTGDTLYLGSRQSMQYGRMYDKGLQEGTTIAEKWFRYEIEYKAKGALQIAQRARELPPSAYGEWIRCTVFDWFVARAVVPLFDPATETPGTTIRSQMKQTTPQKKLVWLRSAVKPTVRYLFEQGLKRETLDALGLDLVQIDIGEYNTISGQLDPVDSKL